MVDVVYQVACVERLQINYLVHVNYGKYDKLKQGLIKIK
jgi:hypothetical protein